MSGILYFYFTRSKSPILELLGQIGDRQVFYCTIRSDTNWSAKINIENWIAFTIADEEDEELLPELVTKCIEKGVCYAYSAGLLASKTEDYFGEEIVRRQVNKEQTTGQLQDYERAPMTAFNINFDEGFWFAATVAQQIINEEYILSTQVICIDCTSRKVRGHLINLIEKLNSGWLPEDIEGVVAPVYDNLL